MIHGPSSGRRIHWPSIRAIGPIGLLYGHADFRVSPTFNIADLKRYFGDKDELSSRRTSFQEGQDDEVINTIITPTAPAAINTGPITRARARQL